MGTLEYNAVCFLQEQRPEAVTDAVIEAFGKSFKVKRKSWILFVTIARLIPARLVDQ